MLDYVKGIIIIHGTDTIEITVKFNEISKLKLENYIFIFYHKAYFLHRCIYSNNKSVVITGSSRTITNRLFEISFFFTNKEH